MRYLITFSYDGSKFHGFQRQKNVKNIQGTLERNLSEILKEEIIIKGSGRTDAKVHALMQTAHFDTSKPIPKDLKKRLNKALNDEIIIQKIKSVKTDFHARFLVKEKTYRYIINFDKKNINDDYYFTSYIFLDKKLMQEASKLFLGTHDFRNFVSGQRDDYVTHIKKIKIKEKNNKMILEFTGVGFYRYMVRHLVGALYDVGRKKISKEVIKEMLYNLENSRQLTVMPAYGLYLVNIKY